MKSLIRLVTFATVAGVYLSAVAQPAEQSVPATAPETGQSATSTSGMPNVKEPGTQAESGTLGGDKPFTLMVDPDVGELNYVFDEQKNLESIQAKRGVVFSSEDMTLNSDEFEYKTLTSQLVASGKRVVVRLGEIIVTCQLFKYRPDTQEGEFTGSPVLYNRDKDGKTKTTSGRKITLYNVNGRTQMKVESGGGNGAFIKSNAAEAPVPSESKAPAPGQKNASMTLDSNTAPTGGNLSPHATPATSGAPAGKSAPLMGLPVTSTDSGDTKPKTVRSNKIDPNNPQDVDSVAKKQPAQ
jgi:hypothetical protein